MPIRRILGLSTVLLLHGAEAGTLEDAVDTNPALYRVVLENDHVRVTELFASAGASAAKHLQPAAVMVSAARARFEVTDANGRTSLVDLRPGQVEWMAATARGWRLLAGEAQVFFVEIGSATGDEEPRVPAGTAGDAVDVDPEQHRVILENAHVRVWDGMGDPGASSPMHGHAPAVLVSLRQSRLRTTIGGEARIFDFEPSRVYWIGSFEHSWTILSGRARVIGVEVRSAMPGTPAIP